MTTFGALYKFKDKIYVAVSTTERTCPRVIEFEPDTLFSTKYLELSCTIYSAATALL